MVPTCSGRSSEVGVLKTDGSPYTNKRNLGAKKVSKKNKTSSVLVAGHSK